MRVIAHWAAAVILFIYASQTNAVLIDFEDLEASDGTFVSDGYYGFDWTGSLDEYSWVNNANVNIGPAAYSGSNYAWSNGGAELELSGGVFSIASLWISSKNGGSNSPTITFEGLFNGSTLFSSTYIAGSDWGEVILNFSGIDQLIFDGDINTNLLIDNIRYTIASVAEPGPVTLLLLGVAALILSRRRMHHG